MCLMLKKPYVSTREKRSDVVVRSVVGTSGRWSPGGSIRIVFDFLSFVITAAMLVMRTGDDSR